MRIALTVLRLGVAALVLAALVATVLEAAGRTAINPLNLFGFFTIQSNVILAVVLAIVGAATLRGQSGNEGIARARACATAYIALVGVVYAVLLAPLGVAGGVPVAWANTVLHVVTPVYAVLDWSFAPDRRPVPWSTIGLALIYPAVWSAVVLARGATDGWVPYPFLDPAQGYGVVAGYVLAIAVAVAVLTAFVVSVSRLGWPMGHSTSAAGA
jgi:hypothetical protein